MAKQCSCKNTVTLRDKYGRCINCRNARNRKYSGTEQKRTWSREAMQRYRAKDPAAHLWRQAKRRAEDSGLPFEIEIDDVQIPEVCPLLGTEFVIGGSRETLDFAPALDRIDNSKGYVKGNVWVISHRANSSKRDLSIVEFCRMADTLRNLKCASSSIWKPEAGLTFVPPGREDTPPTAVPGLLSLFGA